MRDPTSGNALPMAQFTWTNATQNIAATTTLTPAAVAVPRAGLANGIPVCAPRAALPATAGGLVPFIEARVNAANQVTLQITNPHAAALVATGADIIIDIMVLPLVP